MVELIPRQVLFGNPERVSPLISPDGTRLAWIAPHQDVLNVWVAPVSAEHGVDWPAATVVTDDSDRGIRMFAWAHDGRHLLYLQDAGGDAAGGVRRLPDAGTGPVGDVGEFLRASRAAVRGRAGPRSRLCSML